MLRKHRAAVALLLVLVCADLASACYFSRGGNRLSSVNAKDAPGYRRALQQARMGGCTLTNQDKPYNPVDPAQGTADAKIRDIAWQVMMKGGANSVGLLKPACTCSDVNPTNTAKAHACVDWETLGQQLVFEPIPPSVVDAAPVEQAFSLGTFVRLAFHDCGAARRSGIVTSTNVVKGKTVTTVIHQYQGGCDDSFMWEAQYGPALNGLSLTLAAGVDPATVIESYPGNGIPPPMTLTGPPRNYPDLGLVGTLPACVPNVTNPTVCAIDPLTGLPEPFILGNPNGDPSMSMAHRRMMQWKVDIDAAIAANPKFKSPKPKVSRADLIQLSGAAVIALSGGSPKTVLYDKIPMGRKDATGPAHITALLQLPAASDTITQQMCLFKANGYTAREMVALIATHTLGNNDIAPMSTDPNTFDDDYLRFVKLGGLSLAAGTGQQVDAGNVTTPLSRPNSINIFLPAFTSDVEFYTMANGPGPVAVGIGGPLNPLEPPAPRTGLRNPLPRGAASAPSPMRGLIDEYLNGAGGWATHLADVAAAYKKMGKMGATVFTSYGNLLA